MKIRHWIPVVAVLVGLAIPAPMVIWSRDVGPLFLSVFVLAPCGLLLELIFLVAMFFSRPAARRANVLALLCLPLAAVVMLAARSLHLNDRLDWLSNAATYKQRLAKDSSANGVKHIEWADSGFAGINYFEYVVYDPSDGLGNAPQQRNVGIPCDPDVELRFERGYYLVGSSLPWGDCDERR